MFKKIIKFSFFAFLLHIGFINNVKADTPVSGSITNNTIWTKNSSPFVVTSDINIYPEATLKIEAGVTIKLNAGTAIIIGGGLSAIGTSDEKIVFTSNTESPGKGDWKYLKFIDSSTDSKINDGSYVSGNIVKNCVIEYAEKGIFCENASPFISDNIIQYNQKGIFANGSSSLIYNNSIAANIIGISAQNASITIDGNSITNNISSTYGEGAGVGIFVYDYYPTSESFINIVNNTISNNEALNYPWGGGVYYFSEYSDYPTSLTIENNIISGNKVTYCAWDCTASGINYNFQSSIPTSLTIKNNEIKNNISSGSSSYGNAFGGGIYFSYFPTSSNGANLSIFSIENNDIEGNTATDENNLGGQGGGIYIRLNYYTPYIQDARPTFDLKNNRIKNNKAKLGGGIYYTLVDTASTVDQSADINLKFNIISDNYSVPGGVGGIYFDLNKGMGTISKNNIQNNQYYDLFNNSDHDILMPDNWWGSTNTSNIDGKIHDYYDDIQKGKVIYNPIAEEQIKSVDFVADFFSGPCPLNVNFTNNSIGVMASMSWDFGNGSNSSEENPTHTYSNPGLYTVSLSVNGVGWSDTETKTDYSEAKAIINSQSSSGGHITPEGNVVVDIGANQRFELTSEEGFYLSDVEVDGLSIGPQNTHTFINVTDNHLIFAYFCSIWYRDADCDGYGNPNVTLQACTQPEGYVLDNTDCDDSDALEHYGQTWYKDVDGDRYSDNTLNTTSCTRPLGYKVYSELISISGDCNDGDALEHVNQVWYKDLDGDGYSDNTTNTISCTRPVGYKAIVELIATSGDCDDNDTDEFPNQIWYQDYDNDGYGNFEISVQSCFQPDGYVTDKNDCDDNDGQRYPKNGCGIAMPWIPLLLFDEN